MTYTYCEAAMWHIMMPAAFRYLSETEPDWDIPALKRRSRQVYRQIVSRTPDIGSMTKNPLRVCMTGGDCCDFYICKRDSKWDRERKRNC